MDRKSSIRSIHKSYFELLEAHFKPEQSEFEKSGATDFASVINFVMAAIKPRFTSGITVSIPSLGVVPAIFQHTHELLQNIHSFWEANAEAVRIAVKDDDTLQSTVIDNVDWNLRLETVRAYGLYFDTLLIPDLMADHAYNYHELRQGQQKWDDSGALGFFGLRMMVDYFLLLKRKALFVNDSEFPIGVLYPRMTLCDKQRSSIDSLTIASYEITTQFANDVFGQHLKSVEEALAYFQRSDFKSLYRQMKGGPYAGVATVLENTARSTPAFGSKTLSLEKWLNTAIDSSRQVAGTKVPRVRGAESLWVWLFRGFQTLQSYEPICDSFVADHALDPAGWELYRWLLRTNAEMAAGHAKISEGKAVMRAIEADSRHWRQTVDLEALIRLRERGEMEDMRRIFSVNRKRLKRAAVPDYDAVVSEVEGNISQALMDYETEFLRLEQYRSEQKLRDVGWFSVSAALGVVSALVPVALVGYIGAAVSITLGGKSIRDIVSDRKAIDAQATTMRQRPVGILWQAKYGEQPSR